MLHEEFEKIAGYKVSYEDYKKIIEPMYMATDLSKTEFVKCLNKKRFALPTKKELIAKMRNLSYHLMETCGRYTDYEAKGELEKLAHLYAKQIHNLDWNADSKVYTIFLDGYEFPEVKRGCTFPKTLVIGRGEQEYERIALCK